jgi:hypothetical protein
MNSRIGGWRHKRFDNEKGRIGSFAIAHAPFEGVKMGRCLGLYFFGCGDIANMSQPSGDTAA